MEDIFASLARLPTSKRNLRTFRLLFVLSVYFMIVMGLICTHRLANNQCVQMVTALILQLIQCIVAPPPVQGGTPHEDSILGGEESKTKKQVSFVSVYAFYVFIDMCLCT